MLKGERSGSCLVKMVASLQMITRLSAASSTLTTWQEAGLPSLFGSYRTRHTWEQIHVILSVARAMFPAKINVCVLQLLQKPAGLGGEGCKVGSHLAHVGVPGAAVLPDDAAPRLACRGQGRMAAEGGARARLQASTCTEASRRQQCGVLSHVTKQNAAERRCQRSPAPSVPGGAS